MEPIKALYHWINAFVAVLVYGYPARNMTVIAVTGTSGKTTTSHLIYSLLKQANYKVALISSVKAIIGGKEYDTGFHVTTPSAFAMQKFIKNAVKAGDQYLVIEASSHGIAQFRMFGTNVRIAVLTNIAHEHLDWHKTFEAYANTKISIIAKAKISLINKDDSSYNLVLNNPLIKARVFTYSLNDKNADFNIYKVSVKSTLAGDYNQSNCLAAGSIGVLLGINKDTIKKTFENFPGVTGRFEEIKNNRDFKVIVDFAHKPNAFEALFKTLIKMKNKRLIALFGSAGERDTKKRSIMGEIAGKYVNISIVTAEDPRHEDVNSIINEICQGLKQAGASEISIAQVKKISLEKRYFIRVPDRKKAIDFVINKLAQKGDIIAFLGKSHEKSMCFGSTEYPWNEHEEINTALERK